MARLSTTSLSPFRPSASQPWDFGKAAHLLRRAGFGSPPDEVERYVEMGVEQAVDTLLHPDRTPFTYPEPAWIEEARALRHGSGSTTGEERTRVKEANKRFLRELQAWWLKRMVASPRGLEEKLTLFFHSHFATSAEKITETLMLYEQHQLLRRMGLGPFPDMVKAVARDPAMIRFLDSESNVKGRPNENFARELMELYTLGVGNYSETDVAEAARAFTGWGLDGSAYRFYRDRHDGGRKTFLGRTGPLDGDEVIDAIFGHPAAAMFLPAKLWRYFAHPAPPDRLVLALGYTFSESGFNVRDLLATIFRSEAFYAEETMGVLVKSPVQYVAGTFRQLPTRLPPDDVLLRGMDLMGQTLFVPPDVNGWPGGDTWINSNALIMRYHFAYYLTTGTLPEAFLPRGAGGMGSHDAAAFITLAGPGTRPLDRNPGYFVDQMTRRLFGRTLPPGPRNDMITYLERASNGARVTFDINKELSRERVLSAVYLLMGSVDYQMC